MTRRWTPSRTWLWLAALILVTFVLLAASPGRSGLVAALDTTTPTPAPTTAATTPPTTPPPATTAAAVTTVPRTAPPTVARTTATTSSLSTTTVHPTSTTFPPVSYTYASTTVSSTTSTTIASIFGHLPVAPSTVPLNTKGSNAHVDGRLGWLSAGGFGLALLIMLGRFVITRPRQG